MLEILLYFGLALVAWFALGWIALFICSFVPSERVENPEAGVVLIYAGVFSFVITLCVLVTKAGGRFLPRVFEKLARWAIRPRKG